MSKSVKIPETANPWRCVINGVEYAYTPGSTQTVPDEVAALIAQIKEYPPDPLPVEKPWPCDPVDLSAYQKKADAFAPTITTPSDGDVVAYDATAGKWKNTAPSGGGATVAHFTMDGSSKKTLDTKAGALYAACEQGPVFIHGYDIDEQTYSCELIQHCLYDESDGYMFNDYSAQTADDYPATNPGS